MIVHTATSVYSPLRFPNVCGLCVGNGHEKTVVVLAAHRAANRWENIWN